MLKTKEKESESEKALEKLSRLEGILKGMGSALVTFSGGVDSTFLLRVSFDALGANTAALTATSPTYPEEELKEAKKIASLMGVRHIVVESNELLITGFSENPSNRCYYCKSELFTIAKKKAEELGLNHVLDGTTVDDLADFRPGRTAAEELAVRSPLVEAGLAKKEIRALSKILGLSTWDKPSTACLSSRFPYGTKITEERLGMIKACEDFLKGLGLREVRVRYHGEVARIEVGREEIGLFFDAAIRNSVIKRFKELGFAYVTLDLEGYRTGSMNETLGR